MMKTVLIYYPFSLVAERNSGSKLRPYEMHQAFCAGERKREWTLF